MIGNREKKLLESEKKPLIKMHKSIYAVSKIKKGKKILLKDLVLKSPGGGLKPYEFKKVVNRIAKKNIEKEEMIKLTSIR